MNRPNVVLFESGVELRDRLCSAQSHMCKSAIFYSVADEKSLLNANANLVVIYADDAKSLKSHIEASMSHKDNPVVLVVAGNPSVDDMEYSLACDVIDYVHLNDVEGVVGRILARIDCISDCNCIKSVNQISGSFGIVGSSHLINKCKQRIIKASQSDVGILIHGETGTGKELFARAIHGLSPRSKGRLVVVDCASIPTTLVESILFGHKKGSYTGAVDTKDGLIQRADGGTLFLDEISELPLDAQKALLRVLQEKKFLPLGGDKEVSSDFRIVAATNKDLSKMVKDNLFRSDLLFRIQSFKLMLPPLRERGEDIYELARYFVGECCKKHKIEPMKISDEVLQKISRYDWPGNVRELQSIINSSVLLAWGQPRIYPEHLPNQFRISYKKKLMCGKSASACMSSGGYFQSIPKYKEFREKTIESAEKKYFDRLIAESQGNLEKAMELSGLRKARLYELLKYNNLSLARFRSPLAHANMRRA